MTIRWNWLTAGWSRTFVHLEDTEICLVFSSGKFFQIYTHTHTYTHLPNIALLCYRHQLFPKGAKYAKTQINQINYFFITNSWRLKPQVKTLAQQLDLPQIKYSYDKLSSIGPYATLFVDLNATTPEFLRLQANVTGGTLPRQETEETEEKEDEIVPRVGGNVKYRSYVFV